MKLFDKDSSLRYYFSSKCTSKIEPGKFRAIPDGSIRVILLEWTSGLSVGSVQNDSPHVSPVNILTLSILGSYQQRCSKASKVFHTTIE